MNNYKNTSYIKLSNSSPNFISINYDGSQFIILRNTYLTLYRKVGKCYQILQEQSNFISNWDIYDLMIHPYENQLGVVHKKNHKIYYTNFKFLEKYNKWLINYHHKLLDVDLSLHFPLNFNINPSLNLINTNCNQALLEDLMGLFQFQVRQRVKTLRKYKIQGENIKYFDEKKLILSICGKRLLIYKYYHFTPLYIYNARCNIFDITFNDKGLVFIFCSSGLIIWNLNTQKKQQLIQLDPILQNLNNQLQLYYLIGVMIFSTSDQTYYYLNLDENNENKKPIKNQKEQQKFITNAKGNIYLMLEYNQSKRKSNKIKVFELQ